MKGKISSSNSIKTFFSKYGGTVAVHIDEVEVFGDMAFDRASFTVTLTAKDGGKVTETKGRLLEVLRKEDGKWKSFRGDGQYRTVSCARATAVCSILAWSLVNSRDLVAI